MNYPPFPDFRAGRFVQFADLTDQCRGLLDAKPIGHTGDVVRGGTACADLFSPQLKLRRQVIWSLDKETE